jgi:hypothetical protein
MIRLVLCCLLAGCAVTTRVAVMQPDPTGPVELVFAEYEDALQIEPKSSRFGERTTQTGARYWLRWAPDGTTTWLGHDFSGASGTVGQTMTDLPPAPPGGTSLAESSGALLYVIPGEGHLRLRRADGQESIVRWHAFAAASTRGVLWIQASGPELLRIDTATGAQEVRTLDPPFLMGADAAGFLWLGPVDQVEAGSPWPVVRWHPDTGKRLHLVLPTRPDRRL